MSNPTLALAQLEVGDALPELPIAITTTLVVGGALASRDFTPVHHDKGQAQAAGMQDVFMNILTTNGLVGRYVTDWAGPDSVMKGVSIKLGTPNLPGDTMKMSGQHPVLAGVWGLGVPQCSHGSRLAPMSPL